MADEQRYGGGIRDGRRRHVVQLFVLVRRGRRLRRLAVRLFLRRFLRLLRRQLVVLR
jgi:hypothetical protein